MLNRFSVEYVDFALTKFGDTPDKYSLEKGAKQDKLLSIKKSPTEILIMKIGMLT